MAGVVAMDPSGIMRLAGVLDESSAELARIHRTVAAITRDIGVPSPVTMTGAVTWGERHVHDLRRRAQAVAWSNFRAFEAGMAAAVPEPPTAFPSLASARRAGRQLAAEYRTAEDDAEVFLELVAKLRHHEADAVVIGSFIEAFGAERFVRLARVVQAIEYGRVFAGSGGSAGYDALNLGYLDWQGDALADLLAPLSRALATATRRGYLDEDVARAIARDNDPWAVAQLVHTGTFDEDFLLEVFDHVVLGALVRRVQTDFVLPPEIEHPFAIGYLDGGGTFVHPDPVVVVLNAIARHPGAAVTCLTRPIDPVVVSRGFASVDVDDPVTLLIAHGTYGDDGAAVGGVVGAAVDALRSTGRRETASRLTLQLSDAVVTPDGLPGAVEALSDVIARHHVGDLHRSAAYGESAWPADVGLDDRAEDGRILLSEVELVRVLETVGDDDSARGRLLDAVATYQSRVIANAVRTPQAGTAWAAELAAFDQALVNASDLDRIGDGEDARRTRDHVRRMADTVMSLLPLSGIARTLANGAASATSALAPVPSARDTMEGAFAYGRDVEKALRASIVGAYYAAGRLGDPSGHVQRARAVSAEVGADPFLDADGHLVPSTDLDPAQRRAFRTWAATLDMPSDMREALATVAVGMETSAYDR